jgi:E3 ubiquitin-protein ligase SHPRH
MSDNQDPEDEDASDPKLEGLPQTPAGREHMAKRIGLLSRLRECHMVLHKVKFLQGDVYHVLGASHSTAEDIAYTAAEKLRQTLLKGDTMPFSPLLL